jgi:hypothetical protein
VPAPTEPVVYQFQVVLLGVSPMIWRRLLIPSNSTLADLQYSIQKCHGLEQFPSPPLAKIRASFAQVGLGTQMTPGGCDFPPSVFASRRASSINTTSAPTGNIRFASRLS